MHSSNGFFGFEVAGKVRLAYLDDTHDAFAPGYLDWFRNTSRDELLDIANMLKTVPPSATDDEIANAFGYGSASEFSDMVGDDPSALLSESSGSPKDMLYNGVVYGSSNKSDFAESEYGYIVNMTDGTIDCYIGNQLVHHDSGVFKDVEASVDFGTAAESVGASSVDVYPPRLYARFEWDGLPPKVDFLRAHTDEAANQSVINSALLTKVRRRSIVPKSRKSNKSDSKQRCGLTVKSTGKPCLLASLHRGRCRSV